MRLKDGLAILCIFVVGLACFAMAIPVLPLKTYVAVCGGKSYQTKARAYTFGSYGCIKFYDSDSIQQLCDCNAIAIVPEKK